MNKVPQIAPGELPPPQDGLSEGWTLARVGDILTLVNGFAFKPSHWKGHGLPIIRIQNLNNPEAPFNYCPDVVPEKYTVNTGDLLFAWSGTPGTSFGAHVWNGKKGLLNQHIFRVEFDSNGLDKHFLRLAINHNLDDYIAQAHGGVGLAHITKGKFEDSYLYLPPLAEQKRIVTGVEKASKHVTSARHHLSLASAILTRFRQVVLAAACSGQLTEDWHTRESSTEDASGLLERILIGRKKQWESAQVAKARKRGKTLSGESWKLRYEAPIPSRNNDEELPYGWTWATIGQLYEVKYGLSEPLRKTEPDDPDDLPIISMANIGDGGTLALNGLRYFPIPKNERDALLLRRGDLLFNWRNAPKWIGKTAIFDIEGEYVNASFLLRLRPPVPEDDGRFAWLYLNHLRFQGFFNFASRAAVNQSNFNASETAQISIPFPPLAEQHEILKRVTALLRFAERVKQRVHTAVHHAEALTQSILAKTFRGALVPTEAELARLEGRDYEPASVLLERIRAEKHNDAKTPVLKRKQRRASVHV